MSVSRTVNINKKFIEIQNDIKKTTEAAGLREDESKQEETVAATTELSLFMSRCIKP